MHRSASWPRFGIPPRNPLLFQRGVETPTPELLACALEAIEQLVFQELLVLRLAGFLREDPHAGDVAIAGEPGLLSDKKVSIAFLDGEISCQEEFARVLK
jgi:hypothetical protein